MMALYRHSLVMLKWPRARSRGTITFMSNNRRQGVRVCVCVLVMHENMQKQRPPLLVFMLPSGDSAFILSANTEASPCAQHIWHQHTARGQVLSLPPLSRDHRQQILVCDPPPWPASLRPRVPGSSLYYLNLLPLFFFNHARWQVGILVPQPVIKPMPPALEAQILNHWTARKVPYLPLFLMPPTVGAFRLRRGCPSRVGSS